MSSSPAGSPAAQSFARLAASCCGVEAGLVVGREAAGYAVRAAFGLRGEVADLRGDAIYAATMRRDDILEVVQRRRDEGPPGERHVYRFYAGVAVRRPTGEPDGVLAVLDPFARMLEPRAREQLRLLAQGLAFLDHPMQANVLDDIERMIARSPDPMLVYRLGIGGAPARIVAANGAFERQLQASTRHLGEGDTRRLRGPRTDAKIVDAMLGARAACRPMRATLALYPAGGDARTPRWYEVSGYPVATGGEMPEFWIETYHDVTARAERITALAAERNRLRHTLASMDDAVVTADPSGRLLLMNSAARSLLDLRGMPADKPRIDQGVLRLRDIDTEEFLPSPLVHARSNGKPARRRALVVTQNGSRRYVEYAVAPIERPTRERDGFVIVMRDVTEEESLTRRLSFEASHDQLTGISNRRFFEQSLARALAGAKSDETVQHTLAFLDLDRFKAINDSCGHAAGDEVLREIAQLFKAQLRSHDVIARFGGDEFAILMHDCTTKTAARVMQRIRAAMASYEWLWQTRSYTLGVSIGLAEIVGAVPSIEAVLKDADAACYADKLAHRTSERRLAVLRGEVSQSQRDVPWLR